MTDLPPLDTAEMYRVLTETASDAIVAMDQDSIVLSINPAGERLFGYPAQEVVGAPLSRLMPERFRAPHATGMARYLATGVRHIPWKSIELAILTKDGRQVPVEISFGEFTSAGQRVFSAIVRDVSERVAAEGSLATSAELLQNQAVELEQQVEEAQAIGEELEQTNAELHELNRSLEIARSDADASAARVREVLDSLSDAVSVFDQDWRWSYANPAAGAFLVELGHEPSAVIGRVLWEVIPELVGTPYETETRRAVATGTAVSYEEYMPSLDRWLENRIVPSPNGVTTFTRDVTAQHEAADVLRVREAEYRALANSMPTLAWSAQPDGWIVWYNDRWYEYTGTHPEEMEGWGWQHVHHPDTLPDVLEEWTRSIAVGAPFEMTFPLRAADGTYRPFLTRVFPLRGEQGKILRWFGTNTDVYEEHKAREKAERAAARTRQLQTLTALLASARSLDDIASAVVTEATQATGATTGMLAMRDDETGEAVMRRETGLPESIKTAYSRFSISLDTPATECLVTNAPVFIHTREGPDGLMARFPALGDFWESMGLNAIATVPLLSHQRAIAAMSFTFTEPQSFGEDDREFFLILAAQGAQAIERADAFEAERRERERSESIVEAITDGFVTFDREMRFTYVNARAAAMLNVARDELLGRNVGTISGAEESPFVEVLRTVIAERRPSEREAFGTVTGRWLDLRAYPAEDGGAILYFQDITERRRQQVASSFLAEASMLLASSTNYRSTLRNVARAAIPRLGDWCAVDLLEPGVGDVPPNLRRVALVHDNASKTALAAEYERLYPPNLDDPHKSIVAEALCGRSVLIPVVTEDVLVAATEDSHHLELLRGLGLVSIMVVPLMAAGKVLGIVTLCTGESGRHYDETDRRLAEDLAERAATAVEHARLFEQAEAANIAKTEFLRTVSHELRQPLNAIGGLLQLWELGLRGELSVQQHADLERIKRNQQQLSALIEDLLSFARLEAGKLEVEHVPIRMNSVLEGLSSALSLTLETRGLIYECVPVDPSLRVIGDEDRLHQVLVNLVTNAAKATEPGGRIRISARSDGSMAFIDVQDTGVGIPAAKLESVFTPFVQVGRALNQPRDGAGLGLAISRGLAEAMDGSLTASSVVGVGSTFTVGLQKAPIDTAPYP